jgi:hypothetical protein
MKRVVIFLTLAAFIIAVPLAMAQGSPEKPISGSPDKGISCCVKGKCEQVKAEADCTKLGGKVVKDCKDCKDVK